jgi:hypothetical protein
MIKRGKRSVRRESKENRRVGVGVDVVVDAVKERLFSAVGRAS